MAYFNKEKGEVILSQEDEEMFKEVKSQFTQNGMRNDWSNSIINKILGRETYGTN